MVLQKFIQVLLFIEIGYFMNQLTDLLSYYTKPFKRISTEALPEPNLYIEILYDRYMHRYEVTLCPKSY